MDGEWADCRIDPVLPPGGRTFDVSCRSAPRGRGRLHPVTVASDWTLTTPHELDVERIGVALGGTCTCVGLADRVLPAARGVLEHLHRVVPAEIEHGPSGAWLVGVPAEDCSCDGRAYPTARAAAAHLRTHAHWARRFGASPRAVDDLVFELNGQRPVTERRCPLPHAAATGYLTDPGGLDELWDAGVHPGLVPDVVARLSLTGEQVPSALVLVALHQPAQFAWLEQFVAHGPVVVAWAARTRNQRDVRRPTERVAWVEADLPLPAIEAALGGNAYTLGDVRAYAAATGTVPGHAARLLGRWQAGGITPSVAELVDLARTGALLDGPPPLDAVIRTRILAGQGDWRPSRVEAALALAYAGNARDAAAHLRRTRDHEKESA